MCLYPRLIKNKKYQPNKKNGGLIPAVNDTRVLYVPIGCGNCIECRKQEQRKWQTRLLEDIKENKNGKFITLTFSNESIKKLHTQLMQNPNNWEITGYTRDNIIATQGIRYFLERWRKKYKKSLRHWLVTELGHKGTENIHLHGIIWTNETMDTIEKFWQYGYIWKGQMRNGRLINYVNEQTVNYCTKYVSKLDLIHKNYKAIILTSPGIGKNYTTSFNSQSNKFNESQTNETYRTRTGHKIALPTYWRNKLYTEEEREALWLHKLDKQERWVCGEKVSVAINDIQYWKTVQYYRIQNWKLGYGNYTKNWTQIEYEKQRREMLFNQRINNTKPPAE